VTLTTLLGVIHHLWLILVVVQLCSKYDVPGFTFPKIYRGPKILNHFGGKLLIQRQEQFLISCAYII